MKRFIFIMITSLLFIGGCQVNTYPEVPAFEDEFTREFLPSTEEVEEGYYLFESKTGGYHMLFPEKANVSKVSYERNGEGFEFLRYGNYNDVDEIAVEHTLIYDVHGKKNYERNINIRLEILSERVGYDGEFEKLETEDKYIYYAQNVHKFEANNEFHTVYRTFAYILPKKGVFSLQYIHSSSCNNDVDCPIDPEEQKEDAFKMMKSIKFLREEQGE